MQSSYDPSNQFSDLVDTNLLTMLDSLNATKLRDRDDIQFIFSPVEISGQSNVIFEFSSSSVRAMGMVWCGVVWCGACVLVGLKLVEERQLNSSPFAA